MNNNSKNLSEKITLEVSEEEAEDIELDLNPIFVFAMEKIVRAIDSSTLDLKCASRMSLE